MYNNTFWYEKQDAETRQKVNAIFHQKAILRKASDARAKDKEIERASTHNQTNPPKACRSLFN